MQIQLSAQWKKIQIILMYLSNRPLQEESELSMLDLRQNHKKMEVLRMEYYG
jgi:hypothetical protein